ncbi:MAG: DivIVA domain-containing protein [Bacteroidia bacterium]|nr:DivIVA domain-containing protein [Bacteroidia bacterium]
MITPIEIRQQAFKKTFRGYDPEEVQAFLLVLSQEWERQQEAYRAVREELEKMQASYRTLKEVEDMLHKTLIQAEQSSRDTMENARQRAELKIREAEARAHDIMRKGVEDRNGLQQEIQELIRMRDQLLTQLQLFLQSQLDRLQGFERNELPAAGPYAQPKPQVLPDSFMPPENGRDSGLVDDILRDL